MCYEKDFLVLWKSVYYYEKVMKKVPRSVNSIEPVLLDPCLGWAAPDPPTIVSRDPKGIRTSRTPILASLHENWFYVSWKNLIIIMKKLWKEIPCSVEWFSISGRACCAFLGEEARARNSGSFERINSVILVILMLRRWFLMLLKEKINCFQ